MKKKGLLKVVVGVVLAAVLAVGLPLMGGCRVAPPPEVVAPPPEVVEPPPEVVEPPPEVVEPPPEVVEPINVGMPVCVAGPFVTAHAKAMQGSILAYEEINAAGGLLGRQIEWHIEDTGSGSIEEEIVARDRLLEHDIVFSYGGWHVDHGANVVWGETDIIFSDALFSQMFVDIYQSNPERYFNIFDNCGTEIAYPANMFRLVNMLLPENEGVEYRNNKFALQSSDHLTARELGRFFDELMTGAGWEKAYYGENPFGQLEWGVQLAQMKAADPAVIYFSDWIAADCATFIDQFLRDPWDVWILIPMGGSEVEFLDLVGTKGNGVIWDSDGDLIPGEKQEVWRQHFIDRWGEVPELSSVIAYDMVTYWAHCVEKVGDPKAFREIAECFTSEVQPDMLSGDWLFDPLTHASQQDEYGNTLRPFHTFQIQGDQHVRVAIGADWYAPIITPPWFGQ